MREGVICGVSGTTMSRLQKYTCLGLSIFADLDLNVIVNDRKSR